MLSSFRQFFLLGIVLLAACLPVLTEELVRPGTTGPGLLPRPMQPHRPPLARNSGYIFAGTDQSVHMDSPQPGSVPTVQVSFHVDEAIRGVRSGQTLVIREWAGLWNSGEHYRVGERVLLFLYPPSKLGLTSPVGGAMGRIAVGPKGRVIVPRGRISFPSRSRGFGELMQEKEFTPREFVLLVQSAETE
jgi:hypothetical protein